MLGGCKGTRYGCCPDGITASEGPNYVNCPAKDPIPAGLCVETEFGCCQDGITPAQGPFMAGCHYTCKVCIVSYRLRSFSVSTTISLACCRVTVIRQISCSYRTHPTVAVRMVRHLLEEKMGKDVPRSMAVKTLHMAVVLMANLLLRVTLHIHLSEITAIGCIFKEQQLICYICGKQ